MSYRRKPRSRDFRVSETRHEHPVTTLAGSPHFVFAGPPARPIHLRRHNFLYGLLPRSRHFLAFFIPGADYLVRLALLYKLKPAGPKLALHVDPAIIHIARLLHPFSDFFRQPSRRGSTLRPHAHPLGLRLQRFLHRLLPRLHGLLPKVGGLKLRRAFLDRLKPTIPHLFLGPHPGLECFFGLFRPVHNYSPFYLTVTLSALPDANTECLLLQAPSCWRSPFIDLAK